MRYSKEHKAETHGRIVAKASVRLREKGVHGIGVADLMKEAGLTHGGFYAHFDSRETLVIEAFSRTMDASIRNWRKIADSSAPEKRLAMLAENYLSLQHRDAPGQGCAVPTLGGDIVRESPRTRRVFAGKIDEMIGIIADVLPDLPPGAAKQEAMVVMSTMVGALLLARIATDGETSDTILKAAQQAVSARRASSDARPGAKPPKASASR